MSRMPSIKYNVDNINKRRIFFDELNDVIIDNKCEIILDKIPEDVIQNYLRVKKINRILKR